MPSISNRIGTPNTRHNQDNSYREVLDNVDSSLSKYNEKIKKRTVEDIYQEHLQPSFEAFNDKQKRRDRRLDVKYDCDTYLGYQRALDKRAKESDNEIGKKGKPPVRELILQFGNPEQGFGCKSVSEETRARIHEMLKNVMKRIEERTEGHLVWGNETIHSDETSLDAEGRECGTIHLHAEFVPLCFQNKQGPAVQVAFERCLKEMGFDSFNEFKHEIDRIMEEVLHEYGMERELMNNTNEHQDSKEFHRQQKTIKETRELEHKQEVAKEKLEELNIEIENLQEAQSNAQELVQDAIDEVLEARQELLDVETDVEALKSEKNDLEGKLRHLQARTGEEGSQFQMLQQRTAEVKLEKTKLEQELPVLRKRIGEEKTVLEAVETAIKRKKEESRGLFRSDELDEIIARARREPEKDNKIKALEKKVKKLEARLSIFERFVSLPQVQPVWEKFLHLLQKDTEKKKTKMLSQDEPGVH